MLVLSSKVLPVYLILCNYYGSIRSLLIFKLSDLVFTSKNIQFNICEKNCSYPSRSKFWSTKIGLVRFDTILITYDSVWTYFNSSYNLLVRSGPKNYGPCRALGHSSYFLQPNLFTEQFTSGLWNKLFNVCLSKFSQLNFFPLSDTRWRIEKCDWWERR